MEDKRCPNCGIWNFGTALSCDCGYEFSGEILDKARPSYESLSWSRIWIKAITKPSVKTFEEIANDPDATSEKAYAWVSISTLIGGLIYDAIRYYIGRRPLVESVETNRISVMFCGPLILAALVWILFTFNAVIIQFIAEALGGTGTFTKLIYSFAAYSAPLMLIFSLSNLNIYLCFCLTPFVGLYAFILSVMAVKAVNQFDWGKTILSSVVIPVGLLVLVAVLLIVILALLGPPIGNMFSNAVVGILTPVP